MLCVDSAYPAELIAKEPFGGGMTMLRETVQTDLGECRIIKAGKNLQDHQLQHSTKYHHARYTVSWNAM